jgi:RimJ/RimL family protein N-acetyltransferase
MNDVAIERASKRHFEGLHAALDTVAREQRYLAFTQAPPRNDAFDFYRSILAGDGCQFVAVADDGVLGWCDVLPARGQARAHIGTLGIGLVPAARHRGIGARLMQAAIACAWAQGITRIELSVRADNANAKALYERLGFQVEGLMRRAFCLQGQYFDGIAMALLKEGVE